MYKMKHLFSILILISSLLIIPQLHATLPTGSSSPGLSVTDIYGGTHDIEGDYQAFGVSVVLDMSATWCGPCWSFHNSGTFEDLYDDYGPSSGDYKIMPIMVEISSSTNQNCFYGSSGCNSTTYGDWSQGGLYPKCNPPSSEASSINSDWDVTNLPTIYVVAPSGYIKAFTGANTDYNDIESWGAESFQMENSTWQVTEDPCGNASIDFHPSGGHGTINYNWSNGDNTEDINDLSSGDYWVTLSDDNGYQFTFGPIEVTGANPIILETLSLESVDCFGDDNGAIEVVATGGNGNFNYEWSHGATGSSVTGLVADDYQVTVIDNDGCEQYGAYSITEPNLLEVDYEATSAGCGGMTGTIELFVFGGTQPYNFIIGGNEYSNPIITLPGGTYTATVEDANYCEEEITFTIDQFPLPTAAGIVTDDFDCSASPVYVEAFGSSSGSNISYAWYGPNGSYITDTYTFQVNEAGEYSLYVTDNITTCYSLATVEVIGNTQQPTATTSLSNNITCNLPTASLIGTGSSSGSQYNYKWRTSDGSFASGTTGLNATADAAGTYTLEVTDETNYCTSSSSITVSSAAAPALIMNGGTTFCSGNSSELCVNTGQNENVNWYQNNQLIATSSCLTATQAGSYSAVLTNSVTGCSSTEDFEITVNELPEIDLDPVHSFCEGNSIVVCHQGAPNHNYSWTLNSVPYGSATCITINQSGTLNLEALNNNTGCSSAASTQITINDTPQAQLNMPDGNEINCSINVVNLNLNLPSSATVNWLNTNGTILSTSANLAVSNGGTYTYQVTSTDGCIFSGSTQITESTLLPEISISEPAILTCDNTEVDLIVSNSEPGYTYVWMDPQGNVISQQEDIKVTAAGIYTIQVENSSGCRITESIEVIADNQPPVISFATIEPITCINTTIIVDVIPNESGYTYSWFDRWGAVVSEQEDAEITTSDIYFLLVTSPSGCEYRTEVTVPSDVTTPALNADSPAVLDCNNTSSVLMVNSDVVPQAVIWTDADGSVIGTSTSITVTSPGAYVALVTGANGCSDSLTVNVNQIDNQIIDSEFESSINGLVLTVDNISADNSATTSYYWDFGDGNTSIENNPVYTYAAPGTYRVCLSTSNECGATTVCQEVMATVSQISLSAESTDVSCHGGHDGTISLSVNGGFGTYEYTWDNANLNGPILTGLGAGSYTVVIEDQNNNRKEMMIILTQPDPIMVAGATSASSDSPQTGSIEIEISGGTSPYEVVWEDGSTELIRTGLAPGMYMAQITDAAGCEAVSAWEVETISRTNEVSGLTALSVHPNPASNLLNIEGRFEKTTAYEIYLVNALGQKEKVTGAVSDRVEHKMQVSQFPEGLYSLELRVGKQVSTRKLVIVR